MEPGKLERGLDYVKESTQTLQVMNMSDLGLQFNLRLLVWEDYYWPQFIREVKYQVMFNAERLYTYLFCLMNSMFGCRAQKQGGEVDLFADTNAEAVNLEQCRIQKCIQIFFFFFSLGAICIK